MKKKIFSLLAILMLVFACTTTSFAATPTYTHTYKYVYTHYFTAKPTLKLQANSILDSGNRHIKIDWDDVYNADQYVIQIADNPFFMNAETKKRLPRQGTYYNFAELDDDYSDYYIRIRPVFVMGVYNGYYITMTGRWSDTVYAPGGK